MLDVALPDAGFYLWARVPGGDDVAFARDLLAQYNVTVLPGSLLARDAARRQPRRRAASAWRWWPSVDECLEAAQRIVAFVQSTAERP